MPDSLSFGMSLLAKYILELCILTRHKDPVRVPVAVYKTGFLGLIAIDVADTVNKVL